METTSRAGAEGASNAVTEEEVPAARRTVDGYLQASFPWYGLDEAFTGPRWLMPVGTAADGTVQHGSTGHGDEPLIRGDSGGDKQRFAVVVTVASSPVRRSGDGTGVLDATTVSSAAWLAGSGLLAFTWPPQLDHTLRDDWLDQQTETAFELADDLDGPAWSVLSLPVDGVPVPFHYRESEYGWVLAGSAHGGVHIGAYGRGMSAYGLGFSVIADIATYA
ncbi:MULTISPECIES: hypothetical protein [unclassified Streptomyces]|jgi:hypothetical protein|uniref:hypothetical protein n=1 Tax=unclassified Streptomyces TaxID=2593676 RepID=UPI002DDB0730|nr:MULTISPECIES: hypothetical protein [unclassified Streptomyces]WSA78929.1 hypothetical protein OG930_26930 [Streptomyces sp. NBC_01799]WSF84637.1 hypothetical protein OIE70_17015 [Streptomyces sp. NBC_01744]WSA70433.1 hypothetical protein OIE65_27610 [Streptomyces sp. NBC_01800]WSC39074.1 hypothetical protein OHA08_28185 [Streptomyces sp. NBC_01763]WSC47212.1 hypothetical protein OIE61_26440 [Streptomyces sp. NBC_01762]